MNAKGAEPMDTVTQLRNAADTLRRRGWTQGNFIGWGGSLCPLGALGHRDSATYTGTLQQLHANSDALRAIAFVLGHEAPDKTPTDVVTTCAAHITNWNDGPGQTARNVIIALEFAALCEEQRLLLAQPSDARTEMA